ncbi:MAG: hypothetical protein ACM3ML_05455 [Micromonosporaceae bacterium]
MAKSQQQRSSARRKLEQVQREQRARAMRIRIFAGAGVLVVVAAIVTAIVLAAGGGSNSNSAANSPAATGALLATTSGQASGATVGGIQCSTSEQLAYHVHAHLSVYVNGIARPIPAEVGINDNTCLYWMHTHDQTGVIHIESPAQRTYTLGQFFGIWNQPLNAGQVGPATGRVTAFVNGKRYTGDLGSIPLTAHAVVQLDVGKMVPFQPYTFTGGL